MRLMLNFFKKKVWGVIKEDVVQGVTKFLNKGITFRALNCTNINLVPKVANPSLPSQFKPIACYNALYKIVSKLLILRLQKGIG